MPRIFKHLTRTDRLRIEKCLNEGYTYRQIADVLRVHISTIYREIKKGEYQRLNGATYEFYPAYSPDIAEERYERERRRFEDWERSRICRIHTEQNQI